VRKFLDCAVDITVDKKQLKVDMDRAFQSVKDCYADRVGHDRSVVDFHWFTTYCLVHSVLLSIANDAFSAAKFSYTLTHAVLIDIFQLNTG